MVKFMYSNYIYMRWARMYLILEVICKRASPNHTERYQQQTTRWGITSTRSTRVTLFAAAVLEVAKRCCAHASGAHGMSVVRAGCACI